MLWQNRPSVIVGKNQNVFAEVDIAAAKEQGISIVRRITGGGAVYHDSGNVNYTFITSREKAAALDFAYFTRPVIEALDALGVEATLSGRNDILTNGRKISGNAQFSDGKRILHHGTLLFDADLGALTSVLKVDVEKLKSKAVRSHSARVVNIRELLATPITTEAFISHIEMHLARTLSVDPLSEPDDERLTVLSERNRSEAWIFSEKQYLREYTLSRKKRFDFGTVSFELLLNGDRIDRAVISGDFFEINPVSEWEGALAGHSIAELCLQDPSHYIYGMTAAHLRELFSDA